MGPFPYNLLLHVLIWPELKKIIRYTCTAVQETLKRFLISGLHFATFDLRLLPTFVGVLGGKIRMRAILKENTANYISLESLIK